MTGKQWQKPSQALSLGLLEQGAAKISLDWLTQENLVSLSKKSGLWCLDMDDEHFVHFVTVRRPFDLLLRCAFPVFYRVSKVKLENVHMARGNFR